MKFSEIIPYIVIPLACMGVGIFISVFNKIKLQRKIDCGSKIRAEAREPHKREDHNHRLLENSELQSLWCSDKIDERILKVFQDKVGHKKSNGQQ